jgi:RNA polymerase sigma factor (sigma-70 family)
MNNDREKAFDELVWRHRDLIWHICSDYSLSAAWEVEDAVQEVLCMLWRDMGQYGTFSSERTWVYRVATNTMIDLKRRAVNKPHLSQDEIPESPCPEDENYHLLLQLIDNLDDGEKQIVRAHLDGFAAGEIAGITGLSVATIGRRLHAIRQQLREEYNKQK